MPSGDAMSMIARGHLDGRLRRPASRL